MAEGKKRRWRVIGGRQDTGEDYRAVIETDTAQEAERVARKQGVLVSIVEPEPGPDHSASTLSPVEPLPVHLRSVSVWAAFEFGVFAALGAIVIYGILQLVLWGLMNS